MKKLIVGVVSGILMGCGSSGDSVVSGGGTAGGVQGSPAVITGKVVDERGTAVPGVRLVTHERVSDARFEALSGADGSFSLQVPSGVYDLGLDKEGDNTTCTCFYGPIETSTATSQNYVLRASNGRPVDQLFGRLWLRPGTPDANRSLTLRPGSRNSGSDFNKLNPVSSVTGTDGSFALQLGGDGEVGLDLEIFDGGNLKEFIDVAKRNKPCFVEFATDQTPVKNQLRNNESNTPLLAGAQGATPVTVDPFVKFAASETSPAHFLLQGGLLPVVDNLTRKISDIVIQVPPLGPNSSYFWQQFADSYIAVDTNHAWYWGNYAVEIWNINASDWTFYDQTGDHYALWISGAYPGLSNKGPTGFQSHRVSYKSAKPNIVKIEYQ